MRIFSAVILISILTVPAIAEDKLSGTLSVNDDKSLNITIEGDAAKTLFDGMTGKAVDQECTGTTDKTDKSGLTCSKGDGKYFCEFGYSFKKRAFTNAVHNEDC
ncbi:hypothetical protein [Aestuariivirga litoralis]|uniref:hypothetical protein n=1 Tax=Aestuariivirga litoralis TaxID=2650924 RepID=UPI0018C83F56|nr:hypothetical protein [Aestuariivirga litoralis]MBG1231438.1 hypothetical protein [Aestuariivirga litoralis]